MIPFVTGVEHTDEPTEFEDQFREYHSHLDSMLFNGPVEVELPDDSELEDGPSPPTGRPRTGTPGSCPHVRRRAGVP